MSKRYVIKLEKSERTELSQLVKRDKVAAKKRTHAQVLLLADCSRQGPAWTDEAIAEACRVTVRTVENIRKRLVLEGLEVALNRQPQARLSRSKILDGEKEAKSLRCVVAPSLRDMHAGRCDCWRSGRWNWRSSKRCRTRRCGSVSKKRAETLAKEHVVHSSQAQRRVRVSYGKRAGSRSTSP